MHREACCLITERTVTGFLPKPAVLRVIRAPMASDYVLFRFGCLFISKEANRCNTDQFIEDHKHSW